MKAVYCIATVLCLYSNAMAQTKVKTLQIGDTVPSMVIKSLYNYPSLSDDLSAFKGEWVILDFMATTCQGCIAAIPRLDSLQRRYNKKLQIMLVSPEKKNLIMAFLSRQNNSASIVLPIIAEDSVLSQLFNHQFIPHEVWIDAGGVIRAVTDEEYVTDANITLAISGASLPWLMKDDAISYNPEVPLLNINPENGNIAGHVNVGGYATLLKSIPGIAPHISIIRDSISNTVKLSVIDFSIIDLFLYTFGLSDFPAGRIALTVRDTSRYVYCGKSYYNVWQLRNKYGFETVLPGGIHDKDLRNYMAGQLSQFLGLTVKMEKRTVPCLVLTDEDRKQSTDYVRELPGTVPLSSILYKLEDQYFHPPVTDERIHKTELYLHFNEQLVYNIPALQKELLRYHLHLKYADRSIRMLTITEK